MPPAEQYGRFRKAGVQQTYKLIAGQAVWSSYNTKFINFAHNTDIKERQPIISTTTKSNPIAQARKTTDTDL